MINQVQVISDNSIVAQLTHGPRPLRYFAIDGTNVLRLNGNPNVAMARLLTILIDVSNHATDLLCVFDASTWHWLKQASSQESASLYKHLILRHPRFFYQCAAGTSADDLVLAEADAAKARVVSNDRFKDYRDSFSWVSDRDRVIRVNRIREHIYLGRIRLDAVTELRKSMSLLEGNLHRLFAA